MKTSDMKPTDSYNIAVLLSGGGSTMVNLQQQIDNGTVPGRICAVVSSKKRAPGVQKARELGLNVHIIARKEHTRDGTFNPESYSRELDRYLEPYKPDLVVMAGFMTQLSFDFLNKYQAINVHPALLPSFGGKGYYGHHVHEAVIGSGVKLTGATVHFAVGDYDRGPIISQRAIPVTSDDTPATVQEKVQELERQIYPEAISLLARGKVKIDGNRTIILK